MFRDLRRAASLANWSALASAAALSFAAHDALALDRPEAHGGVVVHQHDGFAVSGALLYGISLWNPSYAARPDNSGLALFRYGAHADVDLLGPRLSLPLDVNLFTDGKADGAHWGVPSELDLVGGVTTAWPLGPGTIELGMRYERDVPIDRTGFMQEYVDLRSRWLFSLAELFPKVSRQLNGADFSGWFTVGWFAYNPSYAARPDNTGLALLRYAAHLEVSLWHDYVSFGLDANLFTDGAPEARPGFTGVLRRSFQAAPSELDLSLKVIGHYAPFEAHLAYEHDLPLDRAGLRQRFVYLLLVYAFDTRGKPGPLERRGEVRSP